MADLRRLGFVELLWLANNMVVPFVIALILRSVRAPWVSYLGLALLFGSLALHYSPYQIN